MAGELRSFARAIPDAVALVTSSSATRAGFIEQALAKTGKATPYVQRAQELRTALASVEDIESLLSRTAFRDELIAAAGLYDKARARLEGSDLDTAIREILHRLMDTTAERFPHDPQRAAQDIREELLYRYLLTQGDALGGAMRNWVGAAGAAKVAGAVLRALAASGIHERTTGTAKGKEKIKHIAWGNRLLVFDVSPKLFGTNNIDAILLRAESSTAMPGGINKQLLEDPGRYIACGEIKGGIDPAGADEHWKTARSALDRISDRFRTIGSPAPALFFAGAAIQFAMAREIHARWVSGRLDHAANLTVEAQLDALAHWLISL